MKRLRIILIGAALVLLVLLLLGDFMVNRAIRERFDQELSQLEDRLKVRYDGVRFEMWSGKIRARGVTATTADGQMKLLADRILIRDWERSEEGDVVVRMGITGKGVRIHKRGENGGWIPRLRGYGYDDPDLGLEMDYRFIPESRSLVVDQLKVGGRKMGALSLQGRFEDVAAVDWGRLGAETLMQRGQALGSLKIATLQLEYHDFGLLPRVFEENGAAAGKTGGDVAADIYQIVANQQSLRLSDGMLDSIRKFLEDPDRIEIVLSPAEPIGTVRLAAMLLFRGDLVQLMGMDIRN